MTQKQIAIKYLQMIRDFDNDESQYDDPGEVAAAALEELEQPTAIDLIAQEREKQISKGYTVEHDAEYTERTGITFIDIAARLMDNDIEPDGWDPDYWDKLCKLPRIDKVRIEATWTARELERLLFIQNKEK